LVSCSWASWAVAERLVFWMAPVVTCLYTVTWLALAGTSARDALHSAVWSFFCSSAAAFAITGHFLSKICCCNACCPVVAAGAL
jgi:hypothetical protein